MTGSIRLTSSLHSFILVSNARIAAGARKLAGESKVAPCTDETVEKLRSLQPTGAPNPFGDGAGPPNGAVPKEGDMLDALSSLPADVASGVDGWGASLLRLACKDDDFRSFVTTLTATIAAGTAPGAGLLCVSRITPLIKDDAGGIRPIAVGSLIYRLAMKAIVRKMCSPSMLGKNQLGVKTKGGVEPAIRLITRAMRGELSEVYKWLVSLDAKNAFNLKSRKSIADAVRKHAPALYRVAKWAYNQRSILVVSGLETRLDDEEGWLDVIYSSEGVRQGDPLGPLLFSIAMRVVIEDLQNHLGPGRLIIAYLDDLYILSSTHNPLPEAIEFFRTHPHHLTLNEQKSHFWSMDDVRTRGVAVLGSFIGPKEGRENFLRGKVAELSAKLDKLSGLRSQHALLILRTSYQQQLRHLQRCLDTSDLGHVWAELDAKLWATVKSFRGSVLSHQFEDEIISLPLRLGGMGILSHQEVAPVASKAADEMSDEVLATMLDDEDEGVEVPVLPLSQGERCKGMFDQRCEALLAKMGDKERKGMVENGSMLGRKWLSAIPWSKAQNLTNHEISAALHSRTLIPFNTHCVNCGHTPDLGHGETCNISGKYPRHNAVVRAIGDALRSVRGTRVVYEPAASDESLRRNDLQIWGSTELGLGISEHDVKVYSLFGSQAHSSFGSQRPTTSTIPPSTQQPIWDQVAAQADRFLRGVAAKARENAPPGVGKFTAIVMSTGGLVEKDTKAQMDVWQKSVGEWHWAFMTRRLSLGLVKARARVMTWI